MHGRARGGKSPRRVNSRVAPGKCARNGLRFASSHWTSIGNFLALFDGRELARQDAE